MYPFSEGSYAVRNAWYVAALSHEITRAPMERWFLDEPVVMYRREDGTAVALAGRCPHRQFPMVHGKLHGDVLVCGYHGIAFGANGKCLRIPTQERVPPAFRLRTFPLVEKWKWLWIWMGDPDLADEGLIPDHDAIDLFAETGPAGEISVPMFHYDVAGRYQLLNDNLLDLSHLAYLHGGNFGFEGVATTPDVVTTGDRWLRSRRDIRDAEASPWIKERNGVARVDYIVDFTFYLPGLHVGINRMSVSRTAAEQAGEMLQDTLVYHAITPARRHSAHYFFANTIKTPVTRQDETGPFRDGIAEIIAEDIFATEQIERMLASERPVRDLMTGGDVAVTKGRLMLDRMMKAEQAGSEILPTQHREETLSR